MPPKVTTQTRHGDVGTPELLRRKGLKITLVEGQPKARIKNISPVNTMYERGYLTVAQFSAANKLYNCWVSGWGEQGSCEVRERVDGGGGCPEITAMQIHAMKEFERGKKALIKLKQWDVINQVVINEIPATNKNTNGYRKQQLMYHLRRGLDELARVYGFS